MTDHPAVTGRVLVVVQNLPVLIDRRVWSECQALREAGYQVSVICPAGADDEPRYRLVDGVHVHSYPAPPPSEGLRGYVTEFVVCWLRTAAASVRVARREGFDVMQACNPPDTFWLLGLLWKVLAGKRFVFDQHDLCPEVYEAKFAKRGWLHRGLLLLERATYATADHVISTNPSYQEIALTRGHVPLERTTVVMSAPDPAVMKRGESVEELRHGREHLVCYVGVMGHQDGVDGLVEAIDHYVHHLGRRDAHFALLGFGDCLPQLRAQVTRLGLDEWVTFTGRVEQRELGRWLSTADVGVTPDPPSEFNHRSTMNKTLEYMAHEVAVVATDLRETRRCAQDAAEYVADGVPAGIAQAVARLLDDPERRRRMAKDGRYRIENGLDWPSQAEHYVGVYRRVLGAGRRRGRRSHPLGS
jgi:glycosyltransferase involved in cell wall biosynthesis